MTNAESNFELAVKFIKGEDVEKDVDKATALLIKAAAAGHIKAQYNLGVMYLNGIGTGKNIDKATDCFNQAANQGHEQARHALEKICKTLSITEIQTPIEAGVSPNPHEKSNECLACQSCNKNNLLTAKFCVNCGVKLQGNSESITRKPSNEHANARFIDTTSENNPIVMPSNNAGGTAPARPSVSLKVTAAFEENKTNEKIVEPLVKQYPASLTKENSRRLKVTALILIVAISAYFLPTQYYKHSIQGKWRCETGDGNIAAIMEFDGNIYLETLVGPRQFFGGYSVHWKRITTKIVDSTTHAIPYSENNPFVTDIDYIKRDGNILTLKIWPNDKPYGVALSCSKQN